MIRISFGMLVATGATTLLEPWDAVPSQLILTVISFLFFWGGAQRATSETLQVFISSAVMHLAVHLPSSQGVVNCRLRTVGCLSTRAW